MLELSLADQADGLFQKDIAHKQDISLKYLDHIIAALKVAGLISNVSGKKSGYRLTRDPGSITVMDIYEAFEPRLEINECLSASFDCKRGRLCVVKDFWSGLNDLVGDYFKATTLADLKRQQLERAFSKT